MSSVPKTVHCTTRTYTRSVVQGKRSQRKYIRCPLQRLVMTAFCLFTVMASLQHRPKHYLSKIEPIRIKFRSRSCRLKSILRLWTYRSGSTTGLEDDNLIGSETISSPPQRAKLRHIPRRIARFSEVTIDLLGARFKPRLNLEDRLALLRFLLVCNIQSVLLALSNFNWTGRLVDSMRLSILKCNVFPQADNSSETLKGL